MLFLNEINVPSLCRIMGETYAWENIDMLMPDFF